MNVARRAWIVAFFMVLIMIFSTTANPLDSKGSAFFEMEGEQRVIIGFNRGYSHRHLPIDLPIEREFDFINAVVTRLSPSAIAALENHTAIDYIEHDHTFQASRPPFANDGETPSWGLERIFKDEPFPFETWESTTGAGVKVAVFDTGIDGAHEDLHVVGGVNTINDEPYDTDLESHGTHVAGIIAALHNDVGVLGVAPHVDLYSVIVLDEEGIGSTSNLIEGIMWSIDNNIAIINMSLGSDNNSTALENAINEAYDIGIVLIAAAGNHGEDGGNDTMTYPAKYASVIAVGAMATDDTLAPYSSYGPDLDLLAPGSAIRSTVPNDAYASKSGSSMAAPFVSGVVALMLYLHDGLTPDRVQLLLLENTEDLGLEANEQGAGLLRGDWVITALGDIPNVPTHTMTVAPPVNGTITPDGTFDLEEGDDVTFVFTPDKGYRLDAVFINGEPRGDDEEITINAIDEPLHIEAFFTPKPYTIHFDTEGEETPDSIDVLYNEPIPPLPFLTIEGHTFIGWYVDVALAEVFEQDTMPAESFTLYARFERNAYTIDFDTGEGDVIDSIDVLFNDPIPSLPNATRAGHTFIGWYTDDMFKTPFDKETMPAESVTLYALFEDDTDLSTPPKVRLRANLDTIEQHEIYEDAGVTITHHHETTVVVNGVVDTSEPGHYVLTYTVSDIHGNVTVIQRIVTVVPPTPKIVFTLNEARTTLYVGEHYQDTGCLITVNNVEVLCVIKSNNIDTSRAGIYTITYALMHEEKEYTRLRYVFVIDDQHTPLILYFDRKREEGVETT